MLGRALVLAPNDPLLLHYQGYAAYREAVAHLARNDTHGARPLLDQADALLARSAERLPLAETAALRSSVIGMQIGTGNPASGMWLGPKAGSAMDRAVELGPRNPRVWLLRGVSAYNTPTMWGGGAEKAREYLTRAVALFTADRPAPAMPAWGEAEAHVWLGRTLQKGGDVAGARAEYARALALQPDHAWVSRVLLPSLDRPPAGGGTR
jgi:tetratricopeptide (TPR) repeat protein